MKENLPKKIDVYGLTHSEIRQLREIAQVRYGKPSVSLLAKKLLQEQINKPENTISQYSEIMVNKRITLRVPPKQHLYLAQKAKLQRSSLNDIIRDIISEYMAGAPVLSNDEVQALYQSNYQLLRIGRNINQLARQFNTALPRSITTGQLNDIRSFLDKHVKAVGEVLNRHGKLFKYREIGENGYETTGQNY